MSSILYQTGRYSVRCGAKFFEVYRDETCAAVRCASIGFSLGLDRAKAEADKRAAAEEGR